MELLSKDQIDVICVHDSPDILMPPSRMQSTTAPAGLSSLQKSLLSELELKPMGKVCARYLHC